MIYNLDLLVIEIIYDSLIGSSGRFIVLIESSLWYKVAKIVY